MNKMRKYDKNDKNMTKMMVAVAGHPRVSEIASGM